MLTLLISSGRPVFQHRVEVLVRSFRMQAVSAIFSSPVRCTR
jgi:hypothetical protein